jgi:formate hydrogenlyase subunit 3/multisubunit Na+/H+ antiporter MnhD subunit
MPITCGVLAFAFLSMIGFAPTTGMLEKFLMLKIIIHEKLLISLIFIIFSSASLLLFFIKSFRFIFLRSNKKAETSEVTKNTAGEMAREIAREIDLDSNLILSTLIVAIALFSLFIINFFHHL